MKHILLTIFLLISIAGVGQDTNHKKLFVGYPVTDTDTNYIYVTLDSNRVGNYGIHTKLVIGFFEQALLKSYQAYEKECENDTIEYGTVIRPGLEVKQTMKKPLSFEGYIEYLKRKYK